LAGAAVGCADAPARYPPADEGGPKAAVNCAAAQVGDAPPMPTTIDSTCAVMPRDILGSGDNQASADQYSWLAFIAANWPVNPKTCAPDPSASILTSPGAPAWLSYLGDDDVFVAQGAPSAWCPQPPASPGGVTAREDRIARLPAPVRALAQAHPEVTLYLHHNAKGQDLLSTVARTHATIPPALKEILDATGQPLTDQNGRFVRYVISINRDEYEYIMQKQLWTSAGQKGAGKLTFPSSSAQSDGAMEFKAAWKILGPKDDPSHFFTRQAIVYNDEGGSPSPGPNPVTVGLVGLHITHKTPRQPQWLWSTFEQVDNDVSSFFDKSCSAADCPPNTQTATKPYTELGPDGKPLNKPVQVKAAQPPTNPTMNSAFQGLLKGTPWAYYQLVGTQWRGGFGPQPKPGTLGNSVLETFVPQASCIGCHQAAQDVPGGFDSDFSFVVDARQ
jgi:hypothetical protein